MNYKESKEILEEVKKAKRILLNCHRGPDPDAIGCALALYSVLMKMGKEVEVICPSENLNDRVNYLKYFSSIKRDVNFLKFDFSKFDLFITLDSSSWDMVSGERSSKIPDIPIIVIDHHKTNVKYGMINLVDDKVTSVGELLYLVFADWGIVLNKEIATCILTAIIGDTGSFRFPNSTARTLRIASELMDLGADKNYIVFQIYQNEPLNLIKFYGEVLKKVKFDKKGKFVWSAIPYKIYKKLDKPSSSRESAASLFAQVIEGTDFGIVMTEEEENQLKVSLRSRTGFDTSKIALELGGGGHIYASGASLRDLPFNKAVKKVLLTARKYAKNK